MLLRLLSWIWQQPLLRNLNPHTGDSNAGIMWIVIGALVVSLVLIIAFVVMSKRDKD